MNKQDTDPIWTALSDARLAIVEAMDRLQDLETAKANNPFIQECGVYIYRDPNLKRSDPRSIVYVGNGTHDRPWQPHSNAIADNFQRDVDIEVLIDGLDGKTAEAIEYHLISKYQPINNLVRSEPGISAQSGCDGPYRVCAFKGDRQVAESRVVATNIGNIEALYTTSYGNKYANGGSPFPNLTAGDDYDSARIRIGA